MRKRPKSFKLKPKNLSAPKFLNVLAKIFLSKKRCFLEKKKKNKLSATAAK